MFTGRARRLYTDRPKRRGPIIDRCSLSPIALHVLQVLFEGAGEDVPAGAAWLGHKVEVIVLGWIERGLDAGQPRRGDRAGGQAGV